jgi:phosphoserine phosphatase
MLGMVEHPVAFNPSQKLFREAERRGWKIVIERKNMIYELEKAGAGYRLARTNA